MIPFSRIGFSGFCVMDETRADGGEKRASFISVQVVVYMDLDCCN